MNGIKQHEMTPLTHSTKPDEAESVDHTIQMPGPSQLQRFSNVQQSAPDLSLIFGINGYILGTGLALMTNPSSISIAAGAGISILSALATGKLLRDAISNFGSIEIPRTAQLKYISISSLMTTFSCMASWGNGRC